MRHVHALLAVAFVVLTTAACEDNPVLGPTGGSGPGSLFAELTLSEGHVHTLSELGYTVEITDEHGAAFTDLERVAVERRLVVEEEEEGHGHAIAPADEEPWRGTDLELQGTSWVGTYTFTTSGEYEMRVVAQRHGEDEAAVVYEMPDHMGVGRAHVEAGGYRVEFESFPGHLHAGGEAQMMFWILEQERNEDGIRPPVEGIEADIHCNESGGFAEEHHAHGEHGTYSAMHSFQEPGDFLAEIHFTGADGHAASAEFLTHVAAPH